MFVTEKENARLYEFLDQHAQDPVVAAERALEDIVCRRSDPADGAPYAELATVIFASVAGYDVPLRIAAGRVLALGRYRKATYEALLQSEGRKGTVLETIRLYPMIEYDLDTAVRGMDEAEIEAVSLYFESNGEFSSAAKAARLAKNHEAEQMYSFLASLQKKFLLPDVVN